MSNYPSDMDQNDFDRSMNELGDSINDDEIPGRDENPPAKQYLLECGHIGPLQFQDGEPFCQRCFDEYYDNLLWVEKDE